VTDTAEVDAAGEIGAGENSIRINPSLLHQDIKVEEL
jgi:hypothetical protein